MSQSKTKEYRAWAHAKDRCYRPSDPRYHIYGAKGITMCERWRKSFKNFLEDMGLAPSLQHTLERKDGKLGYFPDNCIWATRKEQANNVSTNVIVEFEGVLSTLKQLAEKRGVIYKSLWHYFKTRKLSLGIALEKATRLGDTIGRRKRKFVTANIVPIRREMALNRWKKGAKAWGR